MKYKLTSGNMYAVSRIIIAILTFIIFEVLLFNDNLPLLALIYAAIAFGISFPSSKICKKVLDKGNSIEDTNLRLTYYALIILVTPIFVLILMFIILLLYNFFINFGNGVDFGAGLTALFLTVAICTCFIVPYVQLIIILFLKFFVKDQTESKPPMMAMLIIIALIVIAFSTYLLANHIENKNKVNAVYMNTEDNLTCDYKGPAKKLMITNNDELLTFYGYCDLSRLLPKTYSLEDNTMFIQIDVEDLGGPYVLLIKIVNDNNKLTFILDKNEYLKKEDKEYYLSMHEKEYYYSIGIIPNEELNGLDLSDWSSP